MIQKKGNIESVMDELDRAGISVVDRVFSLDGQGGNITEYLLLKPKKQETKIILPLIYNFESKQVKPVYSQAFKTYLNDLNQLDSKGILVHTPRLDKDTIEKINNGLTSAFEKALPEIKVKLQ